MPVGALGRERRRNFTARWNAAAIARNSLVGGHRSIRPWSRVQIEPLFPGRRKGHKGPVGVGPCGTCGRQPTIYCSKEISQWSQPVVAVQRGTSIPADEFSLYANAERQLCARGRAGPCRDSSTRRAPYRNLHHGGSRHRRADSVTGRFGRRQLHHCRRSHRPRRSAPRSDLLRTTFGKRALRKRRGSDGARLVQAAPSEAPKRIFHTGQRPDSAAAALATKRRDWPEAALQQHNLHGEKLERPRNCRFIATQVMDAMNASGTHPPADRGRHEGEQSTEGIYAAVAA